MSHVKKIEVPTKFHRGVAFRKLKDAYREKRNRIINFSGVPYMVLVVGRISTLTSLCYKKKGMAAKLASFLHCDFYCLLASKPIPKLFRWSLGHNTRWIISNLFKRGSLEHNLFIPIHSLIKFNLKRIIAVKDGKEKHRKWKESLKKCLTTMILIFISSFWGSNIWNLYTHCLKI